jgi:hypothetical protein
MRESSQNFALRAAKRRVSIAGTAQLKTKDFL